ncbi:sigma-70 family RNA polymerase sigma factor [Aeromicrobium wangtongii]|uniref:Sigma-70 family RNA polymerase sigma factor n=1 Tax=Aeromicrobium wangtongii TaxID=2969247 RepID=A0ABY5ME75_9ACTN|nr:sigma-70 family RNA polymerase sigma factor [Aeromicrobium wangtongii]MCD9199776.1 sigma-70 family RNA polymerase sigma factor [Aeromicrobium wangtongii]UUP14126.1 sigma-70 family RNA polymerase sigma factor [Aeromicrobium wangtongii]
MSPFPDDEPILSLLAACQGAPPSERARLETEIVTAYRPVSHSLARRYRLRGVDLEDLEQVADLALVKALRRFDPTAGSLRGYVTATVLGEIKKYFRDHAWCIRPPRQVQDLQSRVLDAMHDLGEDLPQQTRIGMVAQSLGIDACLVTEVLVARGGFRSLSLDRPIEEGGPVLAEQLADSNDPYEAAEARSLLSSVCTELQENEMELLRLRFVEELSQREIAERVHSTQKQVSRSLGRIIDALRERALVDAA